MLRHPAAMRHLREATELATNVDHSAESSDPEEVRVDLTATINHAVDHRVATRVLKERLAQILNVLTTPGPVVEIRQLTPAGPLVCVRPFSSNQHYWQVYFDT